MFLEKLFAQRSRTQQNTQVPPLLGAIEELSIHHVAGWAESLSDTSDRVPLVVRRSDTGEVIATGKANQFRFDLTRVGASDEGRGFFIRFEHPLPPGLLPLLEVEAAGDRAKLQRAPYMTDNYQPLMLLAGDIVDNCNLRCPFCLFDYSNTRATHFMDEATIDAALRFLPFVTDGNFWFSCRHEPTLHPDLMRYIDKVPRVWRKKLFFTTNLAKRMPPAYYGWLADAALHHVNVSIESRVPAVYEKMRKGARFPIFQENWDLLVQAMQQHPDPTPVRYIAMVYRSNYRELPELVAYLLEHRQAASIELRYTFVYKWIPAEFRESEFLDAEGWLWLRDQLAIYPASKVLLILPPDVTPGPSSPEHQPAETMPVQHGRAFDPAISHYLPGRYEARLSWDGTCDFWRYWAHPYERSPREQLFQTINVKDIADPAAFFRQLRL